MAKGIIAPHDPVILAVNSRAIPHAFIERKIPYIVKAVLPFGALAVSIDRDTQAIVESFHKFEPTIVKSNQSSVSKEAFLNPDYARFSGIISSAVNCVSYPQRLGDDFLFLHNPTAMYSLSDHQFHWCKQLKYDDGELIEIEPEV